MSGNLTPWSSDSDSSSTSSSSSASPFDTTLPDKLNPNSWDSGNSVVADQSADDFEQEVKTKIETTKNSVPTSTSTSSDGSTIADAWNTAENVVDNQTSEVTDFANATKQTVEDVEDEVMSETSWFDLTSIPTPSNPLDIQPGATVVDKTVEQVTGGGGIPGLPTLPIPGVPGGPELPTPGNDPGKDPSSSGSGWFGKIVVILLGLAVGAVALGDSRKATSGGGS